MSLLLQSLMGAFSVIARELRAQSRCGTATLMRSLWAIPIFAILILGLSGYWSGSSFGGNVLKLSGCYLGIICGFDGIRRTCDCIGEERRSGTLGLILMTTVSPMQIVFAKLARHSLTLFYGLMASFPILGVSLLIGGARIVDYWRVSVSLVVVAGCAVATGIAVSSWVCEERRTLFAGIGAFTGLCVIPFLVDSLGLAGPFGDLFVLVSPVAPLRIALEGIGARPVSAISFWAAIGLGGVLNIGLLLLTTALGIRRIDNSIVEEECDSSARAVAWRKHTDDAPVKRLLVRDGFDRQFRQLCVACRCLVALGVVVGLLGDPSVFVWWPLILLRVCLFSMEIALVGASARLVGQLANTQVRELLLVTPLGGVGRWVKPAVEMSRIRSWRILAEVWIYFVVFSFTLWALRREPEVVTTVYSWSLVYCILKYIDLRAMSWMAAYLSLCGIKTPATIFWSLFVVLAGPILAWLASLVLGVYGLLFGAFVYFWFNIGILVFCKDRVGELIRRWDAGEELRFGL